MLILSLEFPLLVILYGTIPDTNDNVNNGRWAV